MKLAIITDIHEDYARLEKAVKAIEDAGYDVLICLGDITGYSPMFHTHTPDANGCIDLLREKADVVIAGNHDLFTCGRLPSYHHKQKIPANWYELPLHERIKMAKNRIWLYTDEVVPELTPENKAFLESLNEWEVLENHNINYLFTHFFLPDMAGIGRWFPFNSLEIQEHFRFMRSKGCSLAFVRHRHPPSPVRVNRLFWSEPNDEPVRIKKHHKAIICPAIVEGRYISSYVIFDTSTQILQTHIVM